jgi:hypothetical protein
MTFSEWMMAGAKLICFLGMGILVLVIIDYLIKKFF